MREASWEVALTWVQVAYMTLLQCVKTYFSLGVRSILERWIKVVLRVSDRATTHLRPAESTSNLVPDWPAPSASIRAVRTPTAR